MSCLCPLLLIKHTQLKVDAEDQCRVDLRQWNRKVGLIFTCLASFSLVVVAAAGSF